MKIHSLPLTVLALMAGLGAASNANATWTFSATNPAVNGTGTFNQTDVLAKTTISSNPSGDPTLNISGVYASNSGFASGAKWTSNANSALTYYSGLGLGMSSDGNSAPNHALDNNGNTEAVLLSFSSSVVLNSITTGYVSGDSDFSVFKYDGTSAPTLTGTAASSMSGWTLVGNYGVSSAGTTMVNSGLLGSSWWLISAYNSAWSSASKNAGLLGQGNDYFKLFAVAGTKTPGGGGSSVPEPASIALVAAALLGVLGARGRAAIRR